MAGVVFVRENGYSCPGGCLIETIAATPLLCRFAYCIGLPMNGPRVSGRVQQRYNGQYVRNCCLWADGQNVKGFGSAYELTADDR